jgi:hypothetical protein
VQAVSGRTKARPKTERHPPRCLVAGNLESILTRGTCLRTKEAISSWTRDNVTRYLCLRKIKHTKKVASKAAH